MKNTEGVKMTFYIVACVYIKYFTEIYSKWQTRDDQDKLND